MTPARMVHGEEDGDEPDKQQPQSQPQQDKPHATAAAAAAEAPPPAPPSRKRSTAEREHVIQEHTVFCRGVEPVEPVKRRRASSATSPEASAERDDDTRDDEGDCGPTVDPVAVEVAPAEKQIDGAPEGELFLVNVLRREELQPSADVALEAQALDKLLASKRDATDATAAAFVSASDADVTWGHEFAALDSVRRFAVHHHHEARRQLDAGVLGGLVLPAASSLRSAMSRNALLCVQDLVLSLQEETAAHFDEIVPTLLGRACNEKQFIRDLARDVLDSALAVRADETLLRPLLDVSTSEKNPQVVSVAGVYASRCILRMDRAHLREFVLETRGSFLDEMAAFLRCKVVECKAATRRSCQHARRVLGDTTFVPLAKEKLDGSAQLDVLKASEVRKKPGKAGHGKLSIRERMLQMKKQQRAQQAAPGDVPVVVVAPPPPSKAPGASA